LRTKDFDYDEIKIVCSPEIEATISFTGCAPSLIHRDENVKLWNAQFYTSANDENYGGTLFNAFEEAKAFVDQYISKGCPPSGSCARHCGMLEKSYKTFTVMAKQLSGSSTHQFSVSSERFESVCIT
jgi:hypothetical protein